MPAFVISATYSGIINCADCIGRQREKAALVNMTSLPQIQILGMIGHWRDSSDPKLFVRHVGATCFYMVPSLPIFLLMLAMLFEGASFWFALAAGIAFTLLLYLTTIGIAA